ncbi:ImmA/IrrE family metallo-endopeptidase [Methylobacterium sp. NMS14P]|uniref:ImmA/IrrE family metallo-endopeptidase n=1 Tax=Methylobacterium sp. NMS14P TaxID=2894310 RepID=UPI0023597A86|nr:ImmA/IrrE family metallo-endopeptidase [Methylobacterium sp. NMS14P]WCS22787.1 ImmA/IrrE family metallo-endopeptidase [Methylobacterium sp. NMS14P]
MGDPVAAGNGRSLPAGVGSDRVQLGQIAPGYDYDVLDEDEMGDRHGQVEPHRRMLTLRTDVYERILDHKGRDRFTGCHEVGHAVLHGRTLNRLAPGIRPARYCDPEWQANTFAGAILMPEHMVRAMRSVGEIADEFGVTRDAAEVRCRILGVTVHP